MKHGINTHASGNYNAREGPSSEIKKRCAAFVSLEKKVNLFKVHDYD